MTESKDKIDLTQFGVLPYLLIFCFPIFMALGHIYKYSAVGVWFLFVGIPILDLFLGRDIKNPTKEQAKELNKQLRFRVLTWVWVPVHLAMLYGTIHLTKSDDYTLWQKICFAISAGILSGAMGFNVAHELNHKRNRFEEICGQIIFSSLMYDHIAYEHNLGHHWYVATPKDPATARYNESFYAFFPRSFWGGIKGAWHIEEASLAKRGKDVWSPSNRIIKGYIAQALYVSAVSYVWGLHGFLMYALICTIGILIFESVNYIEHYGLMREQEADGSYEPVDPLHSWNAAETLTNFLLIKIQRHSDHHTYPYKRYQSLISHEYVAQMPTGYPGMILLALVPPLWFKVMNPRVLDLKRQLQEKKKAQAALGIHAQKGKAIKGN